MSGDSLVGLSQCPIPEFSTFVIVGIFGAPVLAFALAFSIRVLWGELIANSVVTLEWLQHLLLHATFYGTAFAWMLGLTRCEPSWVAPSFAAGCAVFCLAYSWVLGWRVHTMHILQGLEVQVKNQTA